jgi:hypothetical protein
MPNELNNSYDLLGSAVALVASIGRLRAPHFACAPKTSPKLLYQSWRCFGRDDSVPRFRPGKATTFFLVFIQDWMHRQRWGNPLSGVCNCEQRTQPSGVTLPLAWRVGAPCSISERVEYLSLGVPTKSSPMRGVLCVFPAD